MDIPAQDDVIDLCFILSDMKDIDISEAERVLSACYDSLSMSDITHQSDDGIPLGKRVA